MHENCKIKSVITSQREVWKMVVWRTLVRRFVGPNVLIERRASLKWTVLRTWNDVSVVHGRWSSYEAAGLGAAHCTRGITGGSIVRRDRCRCPGRRGVGFTSQTAFVLPEQLGHCPVTLLCRDIPCCRAVLQCENKNESRHQTSYTLWIRDKESATVHLQCASVPPAIRPMAHSIVIVLLWTEIRFHLKEFSVAARRGHLHFDVWQTL